MKKLKLLTSTALSCAILPTAFISMTSCGENKLGITKKQWEDAFEPIWNIRNQNRNFTFEANYSSFESVTSTPVTLKADGLKCIGTYEDESKEDTIYYYSMFKDGIFYSSKHEEGSTSTEPILNIYLTLGKNSSVMLFFNKTLLRVCLLYLIKSV